MVSDDILKAMEFSRIWGCIPKALNETYIALTPKYDKPKKFANYRTISLCNLIYKVITKILSNRIKTLLAEVLSDEQFVFLRKRQIHENVGVT